MLNYQIRFLMLEKAFSAQLECKHGQKQKMFIIISGIYSVIETCSNMLKFI